MGDVIDIKSRKPVALVQTGFSGMTVSIAHADILPGFAKQCADLETRYLISCILMEYARATRWLWLRYYFQPRKQLYFEREALYEAERDILRLLGDA